MRRHRARASRPAPARRRTEAGHIGASLGASQAPQHARAVALSGCPRHELHCGSALAWWPGHGGSGARVTVHVVRPGAWPLRCGGRVGQARRRACAAARPTGRAGDRRLDWNSRHGAAMPPRSNMPSAGEGPLRCRAGRRGECVGTASARGLPAVHLDQMIAQHVISQLRIVGQVELFEQARAIHAHRLHRQRQDVRHIAQALA